MTTTVCLREGGAATSPKWAAAAYENSSDKTLIRRIAAGDQSAMRALFARYRVRVYRWLLRLVDDESLAEDLLSEVFLDLWRHVPDTADDPEVTLQKKNRAEALRQSLPRLSPEHREVIDLAYYHGKSVKEIAEIVSISEATVKTRMFYARRKLAELVETT
jgi:RNA polymerase sigma-70 factor (ECF subfamily)